MFASNGGISFSVIKSTFFQTNPDSRQRNPSSVLPRHQYKRCIILWGESFDAFPNPKASYAFTKDNVPIVDPGHLSTFLNLNISI